MVAIAAELTELSGQFGMTTPLPAEMHAKLARMVAHYRQLAPAPGRLPGRQHFEPMAVPDLLPHVWLVEVVPADRRCYRVRLMGTAVVASGAILRPGMFFQDVMPEREARGATRIYDGLRESRLGDWKRGRSVLQHMQHVYALERVLLPLAADGETVDMFLCTSLFYWTDGRVY